MEKKLQLKPTTSYDYNEADYAFMRELMKVGHVQTLSNQVCLLSDKNGLSFKDFGGSESKRCDGLFMPSNWVIEWMGGNESGIKVTFGVKKVK